MLNDILDDLDFNKNINDEIINELKDNSIHIRLKKRNGKKCITIIENLESVNIKNEKNFLQKYLKYFKNKLNCGGNEEKNDKYIFIQLHGDHRDAVKKMIIELFDTNENNIKLHSI